ncbi:ParB/RepB/Spo0J family partition protein [Lentilactobacillus kisonensis]|uniref:Stage 0 sporulation protein J n=2 Tax=Lentilactobacillus kisonensis TaxID=481722 RepID=H1LCE7_9LACO|nr:ParB/RepB/Spo0J family partition protein [Lentilactobacillus kisonensis]EHO54092.1 stage 0 sporulation protein J [Lentilactobacillus kisonensis F0435]KRL22648.1 stage 0 sporulation protein J [Lentilactobacillus kisonensis DSM 19906 = JCM 15041]
MANKKKPTGLGKGIEALFQDNNVDTSKEDVIDIEVSEIRPNPYQPRHRFDQKALQDLAVSIKNSGVFQPIIVRKPDPEVDSYELLTGERRLRASKIAKQQTIPAIIRDATEEQMMEIAVMENLQREDLTTLEEAEAYNMLMTRLDLTQAQVASRLGKSRPYIANYLRILGLPSEVKELLEDNKLSMGQARTLLSVNNKQDLIKLAKKSVTESMTVRQLEQAAAKINGKKGTKKKKAPRKSPFVRASEGQLQEKFGTQVAIVNSSRKKGKGKIEIQYASTDDLNRILEMFGVDLD